MRPCSSVPAAPAPLSLGDLMKECEIRPPAVGRSPLITALMSHSCLEDHTSSAPRQAPSSCALGVVTSALISRLVTGLCLSIRTSCLSDQGQRETRGLSARDYFNHSLATSPFTPNGVSVHLK
jgi:hypothetical protein